MSLSASSPSEVPAGTERAFAESLARLAAALRCTEAPVDAEAAWRRVEARVAAGQERERWRLSLRSLYPSPSTLYPRLALALVLAGAVGAAGIFAWRQQAPGSAERVEMAEVRLNVSLWQPDAIAGEPGNGATDELLTLLRTDLP